MWYGNKMTQEELVKEYRKLAKTIVYFELAVAIVMMLMTLLLLLATAEDIENAKILTEAGDNATLDPYIKNQIAGKCLAFLIFALETYFQFKAAFSLLRATEPSVTIPYALKCIRFWRNATLVLNLQFLVSLLMSSQWTFAALLFIVRLFTYCEVEGFNKTFLQRAASMGPLEFYSSFHSSRPDKMQRNLDAVIVHRSQSQ